MCMTNYVSKNALAAAKRTSGSGNLRRRGGPSFNPVHKIRDLPSSRSIVISNAPLLGLVSPPFIELTMLELANGEAERRAT